MNRPLVLVFTLMSIASLAYAWKSQDVHGEQPIFLGTLTTQEGNSFYATNITIGRSREGSDKIVLYEKPKILTSTEGGNILSVNPFDELTTITLELQKIKKIEVPEPHVIWTWTKDDTKRTIKMNYEFIELIITWQSNSSGHYLLELGPENTKNPIKIFCDVLDKPIAGIRQDGTLFCPGVTTIELRKKGAPFQSIKELVLDEPCYKIPTNTATMKTVE